MDEQTEHGRCVSGRAGVGVQEYQKEVEAYSIESDQNNCISRRIYDFFFFSYIVT